MNILVIGQCTLHWGRMEFGNIGNYYVIEPFFRGIRWAFPDAYVQTTMQMSQRFCAAEGINVLPMELYYAWRPNELELASEELQLVARMNQSDGCIETTPYIDAVKQADLVIDFSGDIWGDNADLFGQDRLAVGLIKDLVAQRLGKPTAMIAGSPGPFGSYDKRQLAKEVYAQFDLVTNREPISTRLLKKDGFYTGKTINLACPSFLFKKPETQKITEILESEALSLRQREKPLVGFIVCGWNFEKGPFDLWPRDGDDYRNFISAVEFITRDLKCQVCLLSHNNGFDVPPAPFRLKHGRDYPIIKQLQALLAERGVVDDVICLDGIYDPWETKAIIGEFDMLVSGRVHGAIAALSQSIPTVIVDYGHEPKAHKLRGFAEVAMADEYVADPQNAYDLISKIKRCWNSREEVERHLNRRQPKIQELAWQNFTSLQYLVSRG